jgi:hypothetical protein
MYLGLGECIFRSFKFEIMNLNTRSSVVGRVSDLCSPLFGSLFLFPVGPVPLFILSGNSIISTLILFVTSLNIF